MQCIGEQSKELRQTLNPASVTLLFSFPPGSPICSSLAEEELLWSCCPGFFSTCTFNDFLLNVCYCSLLSAARGLSLPTPLHPCVATKVFCTPSATAEAETINGYCWLCSPHQLKVSPPHGLYKEIPVLLPLLSSPKVDEELAGYSRAYLLPSVQEEPVRAICSWCPSPV